MSFVERDWSPYGRKAKFVEVNVKDHDNQTIDFFKLKKDNTRDMKRMVKKIKEKYEFDFTDDEDINEEPKDESTWLKKSSFSLDKSTSSI